MTYLKAIIGKLNLNVSNRMKAEAMDNDEDIFDFLTTLVSKQDLVEVFKRHYSVEYISLEDWTIPDSVVKAFKFKDLQILKDWQTLGIIPYDYNALSRTYFFALSDINNLEIRNHITMLTRQNRDNTQFKFAFKSEIEKAFLKITPTSIPTSPKPSHQTSSDTTSSDFDAPKFVSDAINKSLDLGASDIHIERLEQGIQIRYRVDGIMTSNQIFSLRESEISSIYVRLKGISTMDISEKRKPQDGRIDNYEYKGRHYDLRVSTVTTVLGEKAVMRIFDKTSKILSFSELGFGDDETEKIKEMLHSQNGIILMAGATGSGKTTTLYTMIDEVNTNDVNIYTIEDPVEKTLKNVSQIQIDPKAGIDYPSTLKALLRQDPDIMVVGEIRDSETAKLSIQASLTGHLVLSTIHANGSFDAISRLLDMGVETYLLGASSEGFLSQRLVRKLCPHCRKKMNNFKPKENVWLRKLSAEHGITVPNPSDMYEAVGCDKCVNGYKGRIAIVEVVKISESLRELLSNGATITMIKKLAAEEGFIPMEVNAYRKALQGITSLDEMIRKLS